MAPSRPNLSDPFDPDRGPFICYHCKDGRHRECVGSACHCSCEGPHPLAPEIVMDSERRMEWLRLFASRQPTGDLAFLLGQRDELLASLKLLLADGGPLSDPLSRKAARDKARVAIAMAEGK